ncbi:MAG: hypothetical protein AAGD43_04625 [Pseudomonadota bacterium]
MKRTSTRRFVSLIGCLTVLAGIAVAAVHNVTTVPTQNDREVGRMILERAGYRGVLKSDVDHASFDAQIRFIQAVQDAVISVSPETVLIPFDRSREPKDLVAHGHGECGDRSRAIEKILNANGFRTRHLAIYSVSETGSRVASLLTPGVGSHALSEVLTARGWMAVESTSRWIGLTKDGRTITLEDLQAPSAAQLAWHDRVRDTHHRIFTQEFTYVPGLYSRHGRFYAPYTPVPDVNWPDLLAGLFA